MLIMTWRDYKFILLGVLLIVNSIVYVIHLFGVSFSFTFSIVIGRFVLPTLDLGLLLVLSQVFLLFLKYTKYLQSDTYEAFGSAN